jgi:hypothetical protein
MVLTAVATLATIPFFLGATPAKEATPVPKSQPPAQVRTTTQPPATNPADKVSPKLPESRQPNVIFKQTPASSPAPTFIPGLPKPVLKNGTATPSPIPTASPSVKLSPKEAEELLKKVKADKADKVLKARAEMAGKKGKA